MAVEANDDREKSLLDEQSPNGGVVCPSGN
jgi:hypothetical protein